MAKKFYERTGGGTAMNIWTDPDVWQQAEFQDQLPVLQDIRALTDEARTYVALTGIPSLGIPPTADLVSFDDILDDEIDRLLDILDYFNYDGKDETITVRDGAWVTPIALESVSDENVGEEGIHAIDQDNAAWWQSDAAGLRSIVFRVRDYRKMVVGLRLRTTAGDERTQLQGVSVSASQALGMIDDPSNVIETGIDFVYAGNAWMEHILASKKRGRYLKLDCSLSLHTTPDQIRIREIEVRVGITNHDK